MSLHTFSLFFLPHFQEQKNIFVKNFTQNVFLNILIKLYVGSEGKISEEFLVLTSESLMLGI